MFFNPLLPSWNLLNLKNFNRWSAISAANSFKTFDACHWVLETSIPLVPWGFPKFCLSWLGFLQVFHPVGNSPSCKHNGDKWSLPFLCFLKLIPWMPHSQITFLPYVIYLSLFLFFHWKCNSLFWYCIHISYDSACIFIFYIWDLLWLIMLSCVNSPLLRSLELVITWNIDSPVLVTQQPYLPNSYLITFTFCHVCWWLICLVGNATQWEWISTNNHDGNLRVCWSPQRWCKTWC